MKSMKVERTLKKLGSDIQAARKRRNITTTLMAERIGITRVTLSKIEKGDPTTSIQSYALALHVLGKLDEVAQIMDRSNDLLGLDLMEQGLPKRIRKQT